MDYEVRLLEIVSKLAELRTDRTAIALAIKELEGDIEARALDLTPEDGWPGSNADKRKASDAAALAGDGGYQALVAERDIEQGALDRIDTQIGNLRTEQRAIEYIVLLKLSDAYGVHNAHRPGHSDYAQRVVAVTTAQDNDLTF